MDVELSKDEILTHFQELTGIQDLGECFVLLEEAQWNLEQATNAYLNGQTPNVLIDEHNINHATADDDNDNDISIIPTNVADLKIEGDRIRPVQPIHFTRTFNFDDIAYSNIYEPRRYINFTVEFKLLKEEFRLPDTEPIRRLKELLEDKFGVEVGKQKLRGWKEREHLASNDSLLLRDLHLPSHTTLFLLTTDETSSPVHASQKRNTQITNRNLKLNIFYDAEPNSKTHQIQYESCKKLSDLKTSVYKLTRLSPRLQDWYLKLEENDPEYSQIHLNDMFSDESSLNDILFLLDDDCTHLFLRVKAKLRDTLADVATTSSSKQATSTASIVTYEDDSENDISIDHTMDDDYELVQEVDTNKKKCLIVDKCESEFEGTQQFDVEFTARYGLLKPIFFIGSLEETFKEALMCSAKSRKLLGIYLHSDRTIFANIFCSKVFCDETIIAFLSANFIVWPWDLTHESNEKHFYSICQSYLGSIATTTIKSCKNKLPAFLVVTRVRSNNEIVAVIEGDSTKESMINSLMQSYELFEQQRLKDEQDESQREERERIKREQDAAYQSSLENDKAKRQRQVSESEKKRQEEREERQRLEDVETRKRQHASRVPAEPNGDAARIRLRLPNGEMIERKFAKSNRLSAIIDLASSHGYFSESYKLLSTWPRRDLTTCEQTQTLEQLKLYPQETIMIEEK